ncbi:MAG: hypothetical protein IT330_02440 [Anaerolineae bacterium]|nr:hypothetical protein [Anaerolineae bacterium]
MNDDLEEFVLSYAEAQGALVERPAYGLIDILLPEKEGGRLGVDPFLQLTFSPEVAAAHPDSLHLTIAHPLVERIIAAARTLDRPTRWYINEVRLEKRDLFDLIKREMVFPNAWLQPETGAIPQARLHYYVRFNFKAALISDEKEEEVVSVLLDVQAGKPAAALEAVGDRLLLEREPRFREMPVAPLLWQPDSVPLSDSALGGLQVRAGQAVAQKRNQRLEAARRRAARHLELDQARLVAFYDEMETDLQRRLARTEDPAQRAVLEQKMTFARNDRESKLADVAAKYRLRLALELINTAVIAQPKLALPAQVENRYTEARPLFVWDPFLHRLEPLLCQACGEAVYRLHLCANGHLACDHCIAGCDFCKREFCQLCAADIAPCAVCARPVCVKSGVRCTVCGKTTCQEHRGRCHS